MKIRCQVKRNSYFDSVTLMLIGSEVKKLPGVENAVVGMGTDYNIDSLKRLGMYNSEFSDVTPNDLLICISAETDEDVEMAVEAAHKLMNQKKAPAGPGATYSPTTQEAAAKMLPDANVVLISVPGAYAAREAEISLDAGRHVMMFSDNVSVEEELRLKDVAVNKGLLMMGPDCGTAIINNVPLAFANMVRKGNIGIVAASGTGCQEVSSIIHRLGFGITQAIGVGGRDLSRTIEGRMTVQSVVALAKDEATKVIVIVSKPPAESTLEILFSKMAGIKKPVVIYFIGADPALVTKHGFIAAENLEDAAIKACELSGGKKVKPLMAEKDIKTMARDVQIEGKWVRALYSGGTLCDEAQRQLLPDLRTIYSNTPVKGCKPLENVYQSQKHTIVDLGDDEFTRGKAHPMIDPALRQERIIAEASEADVGIIILDVVLGFGSHPDMASELVSAIEKAREKLARLPVFAACICGTEDDPQNLHRQKEILEKAGVHVFPSNISLIKFVKFCFAKGRK